jgi:hypothetical protein
MVNKTNEDLNGVHFGNYGLKMEWYTKRSEIDLNILNAIYQICVILKVYSNCKYGFPCRVAFCCVFKHLFLSGPWLSPLVHPLIRCNWKFFVRYITITLWVRFHFHSILCLVSVCRIKAMSCGVRCVTTCYSCYIWLPASSLTVIEMVSYLVNRLPNKEKLKMAKMFFFSRHCAIRVSHKM